MRTLALFLLFASAACAQTTYNSSSCSEAAIKAAITAEQVSPHDGDIIAIPSGSCTWTGTTDLEQTFNNSVTIQGAGAISSTTGGAGTTGSDLTTIIDNLTSGRPGTTLSFTTIAGKSFRFTGINITGNASSIQASNGILQIGGFSTAVRVDHCHIGVPATTSVGLRTDGAVTGVADHDYFTSNAGELTNDIAMHNGENWNGDASGMGDGSWADGDHFGTASFFYIEDSLFSNGDVGDAHDGGRYVIRYSTMTQTSGSPGNGQMFNHGLTDARGRATRAAEVYMNNFTQPGTTGAGNPAYSNNSGTLLFWGNTVTQYKGAVEMDYTRSNNNTYNYLATPTGWGFCGTNFNGTGSNWDENTPTTTGYACLDQAGRGKGDLLNGQAFPNVLNTRTGTIAWPQQALSPVYVWDNTYTTSGGYTAANLIVNGALYTNNTDYYQQFGNSGNGGSFNGTAGVGQGLLSARTSTCTTGVGYWATDTNILYVCGPTNTWTTYYTPYTYPHPLTGSTVTISKNFFGMTQELPTNPLFSRTLPSTGIVRLWNTTCTWNAVNTAASTFTYATPCDAQIAVATNIGAQPDFVFGRTPAWAITGGAPNCTGTFAAGSGGCAEPPADNDTGGATLTAMVNSLVAHLASTHPGVHWIFECVNEAEFTSEWTGTMTQLVTYCTTLTTAAHAADPQIIVLGPSAATFSTFNVHLYSDPTFNYASQTGAAASLDAINIHDYLQTCSTFCTVPESIVAAMVSVNGLTTAGQPLAGKPVYFTEGDWGGGGNSASMTDAQKRQYLTRNYLYFLWQNDNTTSQTNVVSKIWYAWDSTPDNQSTSFGGLCVGSPPSSCTPNQAATAMANLEKWLVGATYTPPSTTACSEDGNGTWTCNLVSSPASTGSAEIIFNPTTTPSVSVSSAYTKVLNWDGSTTPITGNAVTAGPDPVMAVPGTPNISVPSTGTIFALVVH